MNIIEIITQILASFGLIIVCCCVSGLVGGVIVARTIKSEIKRMEEDFDKKHRGI